MQYRFFKNHIVHFFILPFCVKLAEFRANQSKTTLLHYLIQQLHAVDTDLLSIKDELDSVVKAADAESK